MKILRILSAAAVSLAATLTVSAQNPGTGLTHRLESVFGASMQVYRYNGSYADGSASAYGVATGGNLALRYTCIFPNNWGAYVQLSEESVSAGEESFFGTVNKAEGGKYLYRFNSSDYSTFLDQALTAGAAYRWSNRYFDLIPRLGIGITQFYVDDFDFERRSRDGLSGPEYISYEQRAYGVNVDYLLDQRQYYNIPLSFVVSAGLQATYHPGKVMYIFAEAGFNWAAASFCMDRSVTKSVSRYDPSNWVEAVAWDGLKGQWVADPDSRITVAETIMPMPYMHLNFGVGIELGRRK